MRGQEQEPFVLVLIKFIFYFCVAGFFFTLIAWIDKILLDAFEPLILPLVAKYEPMALAYHIWMYSPYYCLLSFLISLVCYLVIRSMRKGDDEIW